MEKKKLVMSSKGIEIVAMEEPAKVATLSDLISATKEKTKDVILATRFLNERSLKFAGLKVKLAEGKEDIKDVEKEEKGVNTNVETLDNLVEELGELVEEIDDKVKEDAGKITSDELKDSDKVKEEAEKATSEAEEQLEETDEELVAAFLSKTKKAELDPTTKENVNKVIDSSDKIVDKDTTKAKVELAKDDTEAKKILEDAGEKVASKETGDKSMLTKEERIAKIRENFKKARLSETLKKNASEKAVKTAEPAFEYSEKTVDKGYDAGQSKDQTEAKKVFNDANKTLSDNTKQDKKWLNITASRIAAGRVAKLKKAFELAGEAQMKDLKNDPLKLAMVKNMVEFGIKEADAQVIAHNAFIDGKQASIEQLVTSAEELVALDNEKFVEAKVKISKYSPATEGVKVADIQEEKTVKSASIKTVVSGTDDAGKSTDYTSLFDSKRPLGANI